MGGDERSVLVGQYDWGARSRTRARLNQLDGNLVSIRNEREFMGTVMPMMNVVFKS